MIDTDATLASPLFNLRKNTNPMLAVTIIWHPDFSRIGEQFIGGNSAGVIELSRVSPLFSSPTGEGAALGLGGISRNPLQLVRNSENGIEIIPSASRMVVELNGEEIHEAQFLSAEKIEFGQILGLGRSILLCLHWMRCLPKNNPVAGLLGVGSAAITARDQIRQVAGTDLPVLLLGETGTGKEIAARAIHSLSQRSALPMVTVNMAALNESLAAADLFGAVKGAYTGAQVSRKGLFGEAEGATLFLDEIGNTPASIQPMLLRVLEGGDYRPLGAQKDLHSTARLIAATDQDLDSDNFNQALLRRLESFVMHLPPLRARREDIGVLVQHLLKTNVQTAGVDLSSLFSLVTELACYDWPGNIRQLAHVLKRLMLALQVGETPTFASLVKVSPDRITSSFMSSTALHARSVPAPVAIAEVKAPPRKKLIDLSEADVLAAMEENDWYIQAAAQQLGVSRPSMYKLLETHSQIRRIEHIAADEIHRSFDAHGRDIERCASALKTPSEALRRYLRISG
ncbi:MAG: sigma 54-interacting transcriptional regulator [Pseudomonadota bacterium]